MANSGCKHLNLVQEDVTPSADGCEDCLKIGDIWVHLRLCLICGHVGCCDSSKNKHATKHFHSTKHPIIQSFEPNEDWRWCYVDNTFLWTKFKIIDRTLHWPGLRLTKSGFPLSAKQTVWIRLTEKKYFNSASSKCITRSLTCVLPSVSFIL